MSERITYIYIIGAVDGPHKIGMAAKPEMRLGAIQVGNSARLFIASKTPVRISQAKYIEALVHRRLAYCHLNGEWFDVAADHAEGIVRSVVADLSNGIDVLGEIGDDILSERIQMVVPVLFRQMVNEWRMRQPNKPSLSAAIRTLVAIGIEETCL